MSKGGTGGSNEGRQSFLRGQSNQAGQALVPCLLQRPGHFLEGDSFAVGHGLRIASPGKQDGLSSQSLQIDILVREYAALNGGLEFPQAVRPELIAVDGCPCLDHSGPKLLLDGPFHRTERKHLPHPIEKGFPGQGL
jgi:hypothetical protein